MVPAGETAKTAVVFNGDVLIDGTVSETLVVFNGRTEITGTVGEDVIVFNGAVVLRSGSRVGGDVISRQAPQIEDGATVEGSIDDLPNSTELRRVKLPEPAENAAPVEESEKQLALSAIGTPAAAASGIADAE